MRLLGLLVILVLSLPLNGLPRLSLRLLAPRIPEHLHAQLTRDLDTAKQLAARREFDKIAALLERHLDTVGRYPTGGPSIKALYYLGTVYHERFDDAKAIEFLLRARRAAESAGDDELLAHALNSLSNVYMRNDLLKEAMALADDAMRAASRLPDSPHTLALRFHHARLVAREAGLPAALGPFREVIAAADRLGERRTLANVWHVLGREYLRARQTSAAERPIIEAFRLRSMFAKQDLAASYLALAHLHRELGDYGRALHFAELAIPKRSGARAYPEWSTRLERARSLIALGQMDRALDDLRAAMRDVHNLRLDTLPADSLRISSYAQPQQVYAAFIDAANETFLKTRDPKLLVETLTAVERYRGAGLRTTAASPRRTPRTPAYERTLARIRTLYSSMAGNGSPDASREMDRLHAELLEMEAQAELAGGAPRPAELLPGGLATGRGLAPGQTLLIFHLGESASWLWEVRAGGVELIRLPPRPVVESEVDRFRETLLASKPGPRESSARPGDALYNVLFGKLSPAATKSPRWLLILDGALFRAPLAALPASPQSLRYLVEDRVLDLVPGAWAIGVPRPEPWSGPFAGVGDPVYNRADRRARRQTLAQLGLPLFGSGEGAPTQELARLAGSGQEIASCARTWAAGGGSALVFTGPEATTQSVTVALDAKPAVLHFATHVVPSPADDRDNLLALSLGDGAVPEYLTAEWIQSLRIAPRLVVMSGCRSASGTVRQNEGLLGLSRAWLAAGARAVLATHWPMVDGQGDILVSFYRTWTKRDCTADPAAALRDAQVEKIATGAHPKHWAAWFLLRTTAPPGKCPPTGQRFQ